MAGIINDFGKHIQSFPTEVELQCTIPFRSKLPHTNHGIHITHLFYGNDIAVFIVNRRVTGCCQARITIGIKRVISISHLIVGCRLTHHIQCIGGFIIYFLDFILIVSCRERSGERHITLLQPIVRKREFHTIILHLSVIGTCLSIESQRRVYAFIDQQIRTITPVYIKTSRQSAEQHEIHTEVQRRGLFPTQRAIGRSLQRSNG